jgi:membrane protease YdiL (CAAX protease family)
MMSSALRKSVRGHTLITFLIFAFGYTWVFQILLAAFAPDKAQSMSNFRLAVYGPSLGALVVPLIAYGPSGLVDFLRRRLVPRGSLILYAVALALIPALLLVLRVVYSRIFPDVLLEIPSLQGQVGSILIGFLAALTFGPFAEELGWRGFALPELQERMNPLLASLILGFIWWVWHLPSLLIPAYQWAVGNMPMLLYLLLIMPGSVLAAWIYNHSDGSVIPAILFHGSMNYFMGLLGFNSPYFLTFVLAGLWGVALTVALFWGLRLTSSENKPVSTLLGTTTAMD